MVPNDRAIPERTVPAVPALKGEWYRRQRCQRYQEMVGTRDRLVPEVRVAPAIPVDKKVGTEGRERAVSEGR